MPLRVVKRAKNHLLLLTFLAAPLLANAQFGYITNAENTITITITSYAGSGGSIVTALQY
jgi:hypothetical protein